MQIKLLAKKTYGRWAYYPACDKARLFARIANTQTLTPPVLMHIKDLGFALEMVMEQPDALPTTDQASI